MGERLRLGYRERNFGSQRAISTRDDNGADERGRHPLVLYPFSSDSYLRQITTMQC